MKEELVALYMCSRQQSADLYLQTVAWKKQSVSSTGKRRGKKKMEKKGLIFMIAIVAIICWGVAIYASVMQDNGQKVIVPEGTVAFSGENSFYPGQLVPSGATIVPLKGAVVFAENKKGGYVALGYNLSVVEARTIGPNVVDKIRQAYQVSATEDIVILYGKGPKGINPGHISAISSGYGGSYHGNESMMIFQ